MHSHVTFLTYLMYLSNYLSYVVSIIFLCIQTQIHSSKPQQSTQFHSLFIFHITTLETNKTFSFKVSSVYFSLFHYYLYFIYFNCHFYSLKWYQFFLKTRYSFVKVSFLLYYLYNYTLLFLRYSIQYFYSVNLTFLLNMLTIFKCYPLFKKHYQINFNLKMVLS